MGEIEYIDEPFDVARRGDTAIVTWPNGRQTAIPRDVLREDYRRIAEVLDDWAEASDNRVSRLPRRKR